jgi:glyoxylase I family protein
MTAQEAAMFARLHHIAYRCSDAQRTVDFYTKVIGLKYVAGLMPPENTRLSWPLNEPGKPPRKVIDGASDSIHIFFELGDGSYLAFFDVASAPQEKEDPATPWWVKHIAFETDSMQALLAAKARLEANGVQVLGPKNHDFCQSIYFMDPDGHRLEITVRSEAPDTWQQLAGRASGELAKWNELKRRKYAYQPAPATNIAAMPADSTIVNA